jgi:hypothetical protein
MVGGGTKASLLACARPCAKPAQGRPTRRPRPAVAAVEAHNATLKADIEKIETLLAAERQRADKAIAAFESLAQRLEAMAAHAIKPWWQWLLRSAG